MIDEEVFVMNRKSLNADFGFYRIGLLLALAALFLNLTQCKSRPAKSEGPATPAKDFIEQYSAAWKKGDVEKIMSMKDTNPSALATDTSEGMKRMVAAYNKDRDREQIAKDIETKSVRWQIWSDAKYAYQKDFPDHITVFINAKGVMSSQALVPQKDGTLKITDYPGLFRY
jgi:hypothetical protein